MKVDKHWIEYVSPGSFFPEKWIKKCKKGTTARDIKWPKNAYAFSLWKRTDIIEGKKTFRGKYERIGPLYYHPDSVIESLSEAKNNPNSTRILISNMESNGWDYIVWNRWGHGPQPYDNTKDRVLDNSYI